MKIQFKIFMLCLSLIACDAAAEDNKYYLELGLGRSNGYVPNTGELPSGKYSDASLYSVALGKQFNDHIALDIEITQRGTFTNNTKNIVTVTGAEKAEVSIKSLSAMLNGYYYYCNKLENFRPYIMAGAGASRNKTSNMVINSTDINNNQLSAITNGDVTTSFAWKVGTGVKYRLSSQFEVDVRYQFTNLGKVKMNNSYSQYRSGVLYASGVAEMPLSRLQAHELLVGVVYKF